VSKDATIHGQDLERVYGPLTWNLYEQLDVSLEPRSPDWLRGLAAGVSTTHEIGTEWREWEEERTDRCRLRCFGSRACVVIVGGSLQR